MDDLKNVLEIIAAIATAISCIFAIMASRAAYRAPEYIPEDTGEHKKEFQLISKKRLWIGMAVFFCFVAVILSFILASSLRQKGKVSRFSGNISFDAGVMNVVWRNPFSWTPALDKRISLKFTSDHHSLNAHEDFKVEQGNIPNKSDIMSIRGIDTEAKNTLLYAFDDFDNWGQPYWSRLGIAKVFGAPDDMRLEWPLFSVLLLSEWQRMLFSKKAIENYYFSNDKKFEDKRQEWISRGVFSFPSFLFSEFIIVTSDDQFLYYAKRKEDGDKSLLASTLGVPVWTASVETGIRVGGDSDVSWDDKGNVGQIDINKTIERGLKYMSIEPDDVRLIKTIGIALQKDTLNSAIISIVYVTTECEYIKNKNLLAGNNRDPKCGTRQYARDILESNNDFPGEKISISDSYFWHPTARLRLYFWLNDRSLE